MIELELEKTYLANALPVGLKDCPSEVIRDAYIPKSSAHPVVRLRQRGDKYEITKKTPNSDEDRSRQTEHTINLAKDEFEALVSGVDAKKAAKRRYRCTIEGALAEVDIYLDELQGLVVIDFEFSSDAELDSFHPPAICGADVTQEERLAGGAIVDKTYEDLMPVLEKYNYKKLVVEEVV